MTTGILPATSAWFQSPIPDYFPGQPVAGFNQNQQTGFDQAQQLAQKLGTEGEAFKTWWSNYLGGGPRMNPYQDQVIRSFSDEMNRQFSEQALPNLRGSQIVANERGTSGAGIADAQALDDMQRNLAQQIGALNLQGFQDTENRYLQAWQTHPQLQQSFTQMRQMPSQTNQQVGALQQALQQQRLDAERDRWNYYRDAPERRLSGFGAFLGQGTGAAGAVPGRSTGSSSGSLGTSGNFNQTKGIAGGLAPLIPQVVNAFSGGYSGGSAGGGGYAGNPVGSLNPGRSLGNVWGP